MRIGQNPAKNMKEVAKPQRITVAVLNYIPFVSGFYAQMPQVLHACLESIRAGADLPFDLLVFDNGSCEEVRQYLLDEHQAGRIQYLILSEKNLGKGGAWNIILAGAPGEIIAYTDNDCLFYKGWLSKSVELLTHFPNVGMVTSRPFGTREEYITATVEWANQTSEAKLTHGKVIPWETFREFDLTLGQSEEEIRQHWESTDFWQIEYQGLKATIGASHYQFVAYRSVLQQFLPFEMDRPMGQVKQLDQRVNQAGLLRLMTAEPYMNNMSNTLKEGSKAVKTAAGKTNRVWEIPLIKKPLLRLYDAIFSIYYKS